MRTNPYPMNDPKDYSMLTQPKLKLNDIVIVFDTEIETQDWVQARVVDATFNRGKKCWEYSAVVEFVDDYRKGYEPVREVIVKDWYCFSDEELVKKTEKFEKSYSQYGRSTGDVWFETVDLIDMYIVIKK